MRVLVVHNSYLERGGEDTVVETEIQTLRDRGVEVEEYRASNSEIATMSALRAAGSTVWNSCHAKQVGRVIDSFSPDLMHVHNTFPLISPAVFHVAKSAGVATLQTIHNYRLICPAATLYRSGAVCEACVGRAVPWPGVRYGCYRGSRAASATVAAMLVTHRLIGTYGRLVDVFVAPSDFVRRKLVEGGLAPDKILVKPHFLASDPGVGNGAGGYALFVGRLSEEKGVQTLVDTWSRDSDLPQLRVVGDGPLSEALSRTAAGNPRVEFLGRLSKEGVAEQMKRAAVLVVPSEVQETFGMVVIEAFATGLPVVASRLGGLEEVVQDGVTGKHFTAGDPDDMRAKLAGVLRDPHALGGMRTKARRTYEEGFTAAHGFEAAMAVYESVLTNRPNRQALAHA